MVPKLTREFPACKKLRCGAGSMGLCPGLMGAAVFFRVRNGARRGEDTWRAHAPTNLSTSSTRPARPPSPVPEDWNALMTPCPRCLAQGEKLISEKGDMRYDISRTHTLSHTHSLLHKHALSLTRSLLGEVLGRDFPGTILHASTYNL